MMQIYDRVQGTEESPFIKARIFIGNKDVEATLHNETPNTDGTEAIPLPSESMSVSEALKRGEELAAQHGVPFLVQMDGATWNEEWGMLRV